jgi:C-terminal processing protease CtpA/Prc
MDFSLFFSHLATEELASAQWHVPIVRKPDRRGMEFLRLPDWQIEPAEPYLAAPKAFLIDGGAISYAESCLEIVENYRLGDLVGEATAGTNGNTDTIALPGGYEMTWTGMLVLKIDGSRHHGVGIRPTVPVRPTREGVAAGRDEVLERAEERLGG